MENQIAKTKVSSYEDIDFDVMCDAVDEVTNYLYSSFAPLGQASQTLVLCGVNGNERRKGVSMRLRSGMIALLICDWEGNFLAHVKFDSGLDKGVAKAYFYKIFESVKPYMEKPF